MINDDSLSLIDRINILCLILIINYYSQYLKNVFKVLLSYNNY